MSCRIKSEPRAKIKTNSNNKQIQSLSQNFMRMLDKMDIQNEGNEDIHDVRFGID